MSRRILWGLSSDCTCTFSAPRPRPLFASKRSPATTLQPSFAFPPSPSFSELAPKQSLMTTPQISAKVDGQSLFSAPTCVSSRRSGFSSRQGRAAAEQTLLPPLSTPPDGLDFACSVFCSGVGLVLETLGELDNRRYPHQEEGGGSAAQPRSSRCVSPLCCWCLVIAGRRLLLEDQRRGAASTRGGGGRRGPAGEVLESARRVITRPLARPSLVLAR